VIRDIRKTSDSGVVTAHGPRFDTEKVLDVGFRIIKVLLSRIKMAYPDMVPMVKMVGSDKVVLVEEHFRILRYFCGKERGLYDVSDLAMTFIADPVRIRFFPFGHAYLQYMDGEYVGISGEILSEVDIAPKLYVSGNDVTRAIADNSSHRLLRDIFTDRGPELIPFPQLERENETVIEVEGDCFMDERAVKLVGDALASFVQEGIIFESSEYMEADFPHAAFGKGHGRIRIECYDH